MKSKCARLIALATEAATQFAFEFEASKQGNTNEEGELAGDELGEVTLTRMIVDGSRYCEELETTVAFHVFSGCNKGPKGNLSGGQKLYELTLKCAPVALGVMIWAKEHTRGREFSSSASFPTVSSSILSLVRLVAISRPITRRDALEIAVTFLEHSNSDISYKTISAIRENALRLMIVLLTKGEVVAVLETMIKRLENRSRSDIDASLIRYFVFGIVDVVKGPVSPVLVSLMTRLLGVSKVLDALRSSYVTKENMQRLRTFISLFPSTMKRCSEKAILSDDKQFSSVAKLYGVSE
jgi:TH1 protein